MRRPKRAAFCFVDPLWLCGPAVARRVPTIAEILLTSQAIRRLDEHGYRYAIERVRQWRAKE